MDPKTMIAGLLLAYALLRTMTASQEPAALLWLSIGMAIGVLVDRLIFVPASRWLEQHERSAPRR